MYTKLSHSTPYFTAPPPSIGFFYQKFAVFFATAKKRQMRKTGRFEKRRQNEKHCKKKRKGRFFTNIHMLIFGIKTGSISKSEKNTANRETGRFEEKTTNDNFTMKKKAAKKTNAHLQPHITFCTQFFLRVKSKCGEKYEL